MLTFGRPKTVNVRAYQRLRYGKWEHVCSPLALSASPVG